MLVVAPNLLVTEHVGCVVPHSAQAYSASSRATGASISWTVPASLLNFHEREAAPALRGHDGKFVTCFTAGIYRQYGVHGAIVDGRSSCSGNCAPHPKVLDSFNGVCANDAFAVAHLVRQDAITTKRMDAEIDIAGEFTSGRSVADVQGISGGKPNAGIGLEVNQPLQGDDLRREQETGFSPVGLAPQPRNLVRRDA